jgi:HPt (histidine-containing phosphotransfer) domain-containing protein
VRIKKTTREDFMEPVSRLLVLDLSQLRNVTLSDEALMREVVCALVSDTTTHILELRAAVERADAPTCVRVAHSAHGACGNVGAVTLAALFAAVEKQALSGKLNLCHSSMERLDSELEKLREAANSI